ncbi:MAG TPA: hypothetical protein VMJ66_01370 [Geobacteraceae bacterium]|nr:hypothetical protein [Geobacteraceae bacterium]
MDRRKLILAVVLVIFAGAVVYAFLHQPPRRTVDKLKYTTGMKAEVPRNVPGAPDDKRLHLDLLDREMPRFSGFKRNIFRPIFSGDMKLALLPRTPAKPQLPVPPPPAPPPPPPTPAQQAMEDVGHFTFLGFLQKENRKIIFLTRDNEIFLVKKGDKLAGKYDVSSITDEALTINLAGTGEQIVIPLMENRALRRR